MTLLCWERAAFVVVKSGELRGARCWRGGLCCFGLGGGVFLGGGGFGEGVGGEAF